MKRKQAGLHYCNVCKATTRHAEAETASTCLRCGTVKQVTRIIKSASPPGESSESEPGGNREDAV